MELTPSGARDRLAHDRRLLVPLAACDQYGPHLPIGTSALLVDAFARELAQRSGIVFAPVVPYGVNLTAARPAPGTAALRAKTLHACLNDLLAAWEDSGIDEFILLTVHDVDAHTEAIATVTTRRARVRVVEVLNLDLSTFLVGAPGPQHGGEAVTSLMLHLYPEHVRMDRAVDHLPTLPMTTALRRLPSAAGEGPGSFGQPTLATALTGEKLFAHIVSRILERVLSSPHA